MARTLIIGIIIYIVSPALAGLLEAALHNMIWTDQWQAEPPTRIWAALGDIDPPSRNGGFQ